MLALTRKVDYALIALCHLTRHADALVSARELAGRYRLSTALLMNVLKALSQGGVLQSHRGVNGGYELARPADLITFVDVLEAVEGPLRFAPCAPVEGDTGAARCELLEHCPVSGPVRRLHKKLTEFLSDVTLADIAHDPDYGRRPVLTGIGMRLGR